MDVSTLTIADGLGTPANHTFTRVGRNGNETSFATLSTSMLAARETILIETIQPTERTAGRISVDIKVPVTELVNGISTVTRFHRHKSSTYFASGGTGAERQAFAGIVRNFYALASVKLSLETLDPIQ